MLKVILQYLYVLQETLKKIFEEIIQNFNLQDCFLIQF